MGSKFSDFFWIKKKKLCVALLVGLCQGVHDKELVDYIIGNKRDLRLKIEIIPENRGTQIGYVIKPNCFRNFISLYQCLLIFQI